MCVALLPVRCVNVPPVGNSPEWSHLELWFLRNGRETAFCGRSLERIYWRDFISAVTRLVGLDTVALKD